MEQLTRKYDELLVRYRQEVMNRMSRADWLEYNEILFSAHSCAIEGNSFSVDDTRDLKEFGLKAKLQNKSMLEAYEIMDHFRAYEYMMSQVGKPLSESILKEVNRLVTEHTLSYRAADALPGEYTTVDMAAGATLFGDHKQLIKQVPRLLESTQKQIVCNTMHPVRLAAKFHCWFEYLHPFRDGNGRTGRLMMNLILLTLGHPLLVIEQEHKEAYLAALRFYGKERSTEMIEVFCLETAIRRMMREIEEKKVNTKII